MSKLHLLKTQQDFSQFRQSKSYQTPLLRIRVNSVKNQNFPRFGFIIPKKTLPHVVDRNRVKRRIKSVLLGNQIRLKPVNILFFPQATLLKKKYQEVISEVENLFTKARLWKD